MASNTGPGSVSITVNGAPIDQYQYTPGEVVQLVVRVADPNQGRWGFQITARSASDNCKSEGRFTQTNTEVRVESGAPVGSCTNPEYATHSFAQAGPGGWDFAMNWTAPATDVGAIIFAAAGNAANGNNQTSGDRIYTTTATVQPAASEPPPPTPSISAGGVILAPGSNGAPIDTSASPLAILSIFGQEFAPAGTAAFTPTLDESGKVSTQLAGVCVEISGRRSPLFAVTSGQVNVQAPEGLESGPHSVRVIRACGESNEVGSEAQTVTFASAAPGFFVFPQFGGANGANPIAALHGGSGPDVVAPVGLFPDTADTQFRPAAPGDVVSLFATGLGATNPAYAAGEIPVNKNPSNPIGNVTANVAITIGGVTLAPEDVFYVGAAPCCAGLYQLAVRVPASLGPGQHAVTVSVDGIASPPGPFIPVE